MEQRGEPCPVCLRSQGAQVGDGRRYLVINMFCLCDKENRQLIQLSQPAPVQGSEEGIRECNWWLVISYFPLGRRQM